MRLHITRHGQPDFSNLGPVDNPEFPPQDPPLSALGRRQAEWLGRALREQGFRGIIHSSPYRRTLETASIIADVVEAPVALAPGFQEIVRWEGAAPWTGMSPAAIAAGFPRVIQAEALPWPWLLEGPQDEAALDARVQVVLDAVVGAGGEALLVGHGATVFTAINLLMTEAEQLRVAERGQNWNCAQTTFDLRPDGRWDSVRFRTAAHLPPDAVTSNLDTPASLGIFRVT